MQLITAMAHKGLCCPQLTPVPTWDQHGGWGVQLANEGASCLAPVIGLAGSLGGVTIWWHLLLLSCHWCPREGTHRAQHQGTGIGAAVLGTSTAPATAGWVDRQMDGWVHGQMDGSWNHRVIKAGKAFSDPQAQPPPVPPCPWTRPSVPHFHRLWKTPGMGTLPPPVSVNGWMDRWMNGQTDGWMDGLEKGGRAGQTAEPRWQMRRFQVMLTSPLMGFIKGGC